MQNLKILNSKETKHITEQLERQYGFTEKLKFIFLMNKDNRIYLLSKAAASIDLDILRIDSMGIYFGELYKESIRLSIEGAQIIGPKSSKNCLIIDKEKMLEWVKGADITVDSENNEELIAAKDFLIVKYIDPATNTEDILGCGKYKEGKIINYVSKSRKLVVVNE
jgi:NOL1/NOP2/fmu family ribosome biogenesis protein